MSADTAVMPTPKKPKSNASAGKQPEQRPDESYRKAFKNARIPRKLAEVATTRAEELMQDFTQYVKDAVRMRLEAEGKWPPKPAEGQSSS